MIEIGIFWIGLNQTDNLSLKISMELFITSIKIMVLIPLKFHF